MAEPRRMTDEQFMDAVRITWDLMAELLRRREAEKVLVEALQEAANIDFENVRIKAAAALKAAGY